MPGLNWVYFADVSRPLEIFGDLSQAYRRYIYIYIYIYREREREVLCCKPPVVQSVFTNEIGTPNPNYNPR